MSGNSLRQTVRTHRASVHQAAKLVAALLRIAGVTAGLAESNGSLPPGLWLTSPVGWLPRTGISYGTLRSVIEYGLALPFIVMMSQCVRRIDWPLQRLQSGDNRRRVHGSERSTNCLRASRAGDVAACSRTSGFRQTARHSSLAWREATAPYRTALRCVNYTVSQKKQDSKLLAITSPTIIRFSKFFLSADSVVNLQQIRV